MSQVITATIDAGVLKPDDDLTLPSGTRVRVTIEPLHERGSPAAVLAVMRSGPHVPPEDVDELERIIAEDQGPPAEVDLFSDEVDDGDLP